MVDFQICQFWLFGVSRWVHFHTYENLVYTGESEGHTRVRPDGGNFAEPKSAEKKVDRSKNRTLKKVNSANSRIWQVLKMPCRPTSVAEAPEKAPSRRVSRAPHFRHTNPGKKFENRNPKSDGCEKLPDFAECVFLCYFPGLHFCPNVFRFSCTTFGAL